MALRPSGERARTRRLQSLRSQCTITTKTTSEARRGTPQATASAALGLGQRGHRTRIGPSREWRQHGGRQTATGRPRRTEGTPDRGTKRGGSAGPMGLEFGLHRAERGGRGRGGRRSSSSSMSSSPAPSSLSQMHLHAQCRKNLDGKMELEANRSMMMK